MDTFTVLTDWFNWLLLTGVMLFKDLIAWLVAVIGQLGYPGIVGLMFLESSFFPFPSEVVVPPAGYLAWKGEMNLFAVIFSGILGSVLGGLFNYWISVKWGRPFFEKYGRYFLVTPEALDKAEVFFAKHGHISTFTGRLIPVIRQYISLPAGLARMPLRSFCFYTALGSGIWVVILALVGYFFGSSQALIHAQIKKITVVILLSCAAIIFLYISRLRKKEKKADQDQ